MISSFADKVKLSVYSLWPYWRQLEGKREHPLAKTMKRQGRYIAFKCGIMVYLLLGLGGWSQITHGMKQQPIAPLFSDVLSPPQFSHQLRGTKESEPLIFLLLGTFKMSIFVCSSWQIHTTAQEVQHLFMAGTSNSHRNKRKTWKSTELRTVHKHELPAT